MNNNKKITDIFFDLDHTLYDFDANAKATFDEAFRLFNVPEQANFMEIFSPINDRYWQQLTHNKVSREALRYGRLKESFDVLGVSVTDEIINGVSDFFMENLCKKGQVFPGTFEVLTYLQPKYNLHLITNGPEEIQQQKLEVSLLKPYFKTMTTSERAGVKKPYPQIFEFALKSAKTQADQSVMIGDNPEADIEGALKAGLSAVYFNEKKIANPKKFTEIYHLEQIKNIL